MDQWTEGLVRGYDAVADEYAIRVYGELADKPFDRDLLDMFADEVGDRGSVWDLGTGPGHVARYLFDRDVQVSGLDISPGMVRKAEELNPGMTFTVGSMVHLPFENSSVAGLTAFYSIIHLRPEERPAAFGEMLRVLQPGGSLMIAFHIGDETRHLEEWWGNEVSIDFHFLQPALIEEELRAAGFDIREHLVRDPYPEVEHPSRRAYIWAQKPQKSV
jgi:ubiquinone/menaquinone biosynthesis C-methylase UbiE